MEEIQKETPKNIPISSDVVNEVVEPIESNPISPKKVRVLPWVILGLVISIVIAGTGTLVWKLVLKNKEADLIVNAPSVVVLPTSNPTPTEETTTLVPQEVLFEPEPYRNELAGFEISVPLGWRIDDSGKSGAIVILINPKTTNASGSALLTFINVTSGESGTSLDEEIKSSKEDLTRLFTAYTIEEDKELLLGGNAYHLLGGSYIMHNTKMKNRNIITIFKDRGYAVSATSPESVWSTNELLLNACLFSFKPF